MNIPQQPNLILRNGHKTEAHLRYPTGHLDSGACEVAWEIKAFAAKPDSLNSVPRTATVGRETRQLLTAVPWPPHAHPGMPTPKPPR